MQNTTLRIGTRGSPLALAQAAETRARLMAAHGLPEDAFPIEIISTSGDRILDRPLAEVGGKGLFTKEIEEALLANRIDIAVHSSKDMPTVLPESLELSAFLPREDSRDGFVGRAAPSIREMPKGAVIGSASLRRQALIKRMRPDLEVVTFRGNVQTRLRKLENGDVHATILAVAGLNRLGMIEVATDLMSLKDFPPAPGQGAIGIETRIGDAHALAMLAPIAHRDTGLALACERAFLAVLDGSCRTPIAGHAVIEDERMRFSGMVLSPDGTEAHDIAMDGLDGDAAALGRKAGAELRDKAGTRFFEGWG